MESINQSVARIAADERAKTAVQWSPQQKNFLEWAKNGAGSCVLIAVAGAGKCLGKGTPVLKFNGDIVPVESIVAGDLLMGPDSTPRRVLRTNKGSGPLRRIVPVKGDSWVCNDVHVMTLVGTNRKHGQIIDMPLDVYQAWIKQMPSTKMDWKLWRTGVDWLQSATEMDPYILGAWLGDGTRNEAHITNPEPEIIEACRQYANQVGQTVTLTEERNFAENNLQRISFTNDRKANPIRRYLRSLSGDRIPREYLINSRAIRLQMLAGLLDTDGHNSHSGFEIITKYDQLSEDILFLVRSLGLAAYKTRKTGTIKSTGFSGDYWRIFISGDTDEVPLRVVRKQAGVRQQIKRVNVTGFEIENLRKGTYYGFTLDGDGRFLLGDFTVTHNTTVLLQAGEEMRGQVAYVAYNKDIVEETKSKLAARGIDWKKMQAGTAHSFGFSALRKQLGDVKVEGYKVANILDDLFLPNSQYEGGGLEPFNKRKELEPFKSNIQQLVSLAKQAIFGVGNSKHEDDAVWYEMADHHDIFDDEDRPPVERIVHMAQQVLKISNSIDEIIDFDDMIYLPLLYRAPFWKFDVVMIDEAQDTNAARRALVRAMLKRGGRVIAVGDPHQAIYGFTGADSDALELIKQDHNAIELPLTVSYRCPQNVVKFAQQWVSHIEAAPTAPEGEVGATTMEDFLKRNDLTGGAAVLSRTNRPNVDLAFTLIRKGIACRIEGRDIAKSIIKMMTRWKIKTTEQLEKKMAEHLEKETTKLLAAKKEVQLARLQDTIETIKVVIDECRKDKQYDIQDAVNRINGLFGDDVKNVLVLSSIHKAKGREWETVFWLDRAGTCPSKWARQKWQQRQESNLQYVAATRAKHQLIDIIVPPKKAA